MIIIAIKKIGRFEYKYFRNWNISEISVYQMRILSYTYTHTAYFYENGYILCSMCIFYIMC